MDVTHCSLTNVRCREVVTSSRMSWMGAVQPNEPTAAQNSSTLRSRSPSVSLHFHPLSEGERVLYVDAEIANGAFYFRMSEQKLDRAQVAGLFADD
jgi:hypothetical protein